MKSTLVDIFRVVIGIIIPLAALNTGLGAGRSEGSFLLQHRSLLWRSLLAILVLVPIWTYLFVRVLPLPDVLAAGILVAVLAVGIGPAAAMKRIAGSTPQARYALELNATVMTLSLVFIPLAVAILGALLHRPLHLDAREVAKIVFGRALVPLVMGVAVARLSPEFAASARRYLGITVNVVLAIVLLLVLVATWRNLLAIGARGWLACFAVASGAVAIGHFLGGPEPETRLVLATSSSLRFPALALLLAALAAREKQIIPVVLAYIFASLILMGLYGRLTAARAQRRGSAPPAATAAPEMGPTPHRA